MTAAVMDQRATRTRPVRRTTPRPVTRRVAQRRRVFLVRRVAVMLVVLAMGIGIASLWALRSEAASGDAVAATVVVAPGDTVWDIALDYVPQGVHPQAYVATVLQHNDLDAGAVVPGTVLELPRP